MKKLFFLLLCFAFFSSIDLNAGCRNKEKGSVSEIDDSLSFNDVLRKRDESHKNVRQVSYGFFANPTPIVPISLPNTLTRVSFSEEAITSGGIRRTRNGGILVSNPGLYQINYEINVGNGAQAADVLTAVVGMRKTRNTKPVCLSSRQVYIPPAGGGGLTTIPVLSVGSAVVKIKKKAVINLFYETNGAAALFTLLPAITSGATFSLEIIRIGNVH